MRPLILILLVIDIKPHAEALQLVSQGVAERLQLNVDSPHLAVCIAHEAQQEQVLRQLHVLFQLLLLLLDFVVVFHLLLLCPLLLSQFPLFPVAGVFEL